MKARKVKGLDPDGTLADNVERIVRVRLDELYSFFPLALEPTAVTTQHDVRIAAKRLRYVLEVTSPIFGPYAARAAKRAREIQDLLGEMHDCDVLLPRVVEELLKLRAADASELVRRADGGADLDPALVTDAPGRPAYVGLSMLAVYLGARRELLFQRFRKLWRDLERRDFRGRIERALSERVDAPAEEGLVAR